MIKKFLLILSLILVIITTCGSSYAYSDDLTEETQMLMKLGLWQDERVTRDSFITSLAGYLYEDMSLFGDAEAIARQTGMIALTGEYDGKAKLTVGEAIKYCVVALGYSAQAEGEGGYPNGYMSVGAQLGILTGISDTADDRLADETAIKMIYNMLEVEPLQSYVNKYGVECKVFIGDSTLLGLNRDIYKAEGIMTANTFTSYYGGEGTGISGCVAIDDELYIADLAAGEYLGQKVTVYYKELGDDEKEIVYISADEKDNNVLIIEDESIENVSESFEYIEYVNETGSVKKAKLSDNFRMIYNGKYGGKATVADLSPEIGSLKLIDNDNDNKYDLVSVTSYETIVVSSIDAGKGIINNRYTYENRVPNLKIDTDFDYCSVYNMKGEQIKLSDIAIDDVINVAISKGTDERVIKIYRCDPMKVEGIVSERNSDEKTIFIGDIGYKLSPDFEHQLKSENKSLEVGKNYIFYIDYFGNIAYMKTVAETDYMLVQKIFENEDEEICYIVYFDTNGVWHTAPLADKVTLDGGEGMSASSVVKALGKFDPEIMKLKFNGRSEVISIDQPKEANGYIKDEFTKTPSTNYKYYRASVKALDMKVWLADNAKIFIVPLETSNREEYRVKNATSHFVSDNSYTVEAYDITEFGFTGMFKVQETEASKTSGMSKNGLFLVTGLFDTFVDGEPVSGAVGNFGMWEELSVTGKSIDTFAGIQPGDVLRISFNTVTGRVDLVRKVDLDNMQFDGNDYYRSSLFIKGTYAGVDTDNGAARIEHSYGGKTESLTVRLTSTMRVFFYDRAKNICETKTADSLMIGDEVLVRTSYGIVQELICFR